jgi:hypothetical protein
MRAFSSHKSEGVLLSSLSFGYGPEQGRWRQHLSLAQAAYDFHQQDFVFNGEGGLFIFRHAAGKPAAAGFFVRCTERKKRAQAPSRPGSLSLESET